MTQKINAATSVYRYDLTDQLTNSTGSATYSASYDAVGNRLTADGIDQAGLMRAGDEHADAMYAIITDHLGSVVAILDSNGDLVETYEYTPFGKTTIKNSSGTVISESVLNNVLGFTGREFDTNTGLYYYRNRWYSPDLGRFLEPDPIGLRARDVSLYRYVGNEPISRTDPEGASALIGGVLVVVVTFWFLVQVGKKIKKKQESINPVDDPLGIGVTPVVPPIICKEIAKGALCGPVTPAGSGVELVTGVAKAVVVDEAVETACPSP